jgi:hypothetical protein
MTVDNLFIFHDKVSIFKVPVSRVKAEVSFLKSMNNKSTAGLLKM